LPLLRGHVARELVERCKDLSSSLQLATAPSFLGLEPFGLSRPVGKRDDQQQTKDEAEEPDQERVSTPRFHRRSVRIERLVEIGVLFDGHTV